MNLTKYKLLNLKSFKVISCADKQALTQNAQIWKNKDIPFLAFRLNPETESYTPLEEVKTDCFSSW